MGQEDQASNYMNELYKAAVLGDWHTVVTAYTCSSSKIIDSHKLAGAKNDTALHVAVVTANHKTEYVSKIIGGIPRDHVSEMLRMRNHRGNTPLHLAAAMGKVEMCWHIAYEDKSLIDERNGEGETPLFLAARRGHQEAFLYLEHHFGKNDITVRNVHMNSSGDTILHSAIRGQHYGLAIRILESYPNLVGHPNKESLTPLHELALQPPSFKSRSTSYLGLFGFIFYHCINLRRYAWEDQKDMKDIEEIIQSQKSREHPQNSETRYDICNIFKRMFFCVFGHRSCNYAGGRTGLEGGNRRQIRMETEDLAQKRKWIRKDRPFRTICFLILGMLELIYLHLLFSVRDWLLSIVKMKRKHKLAEQLLNELLDKARFYKLPKVKEASASSTSEPRSVHCLKKRLTSHEHLPLPGNNGTVAGTATSTPQMEELLAQERQLLEVSREVVVPVEQFNEPFTPGETPLLAAARLGIVEMVDAILNKFPWAILDEDREGKNAVLLAAENRRVRVYRLLEKKIMVKESIFCQVDANGNSALHLASRYNPNGNWLAPGPALQLKWEIMWYQFVKSSMPSNFFALQNKDRKTAREIFIESHRHLRKEGKDWVTTICTAYSVVSTLITAAALATSLNIPGGYNHGIPEFKSELAFSVFSISSVVALCTSMSALVFFIAILTTQHEQEDFAIRIPNWLQFGLMFLFASIASMLVSFSSGFYFSVRSNLEYAAYPIFAVMCLPVTLFAVAQHPLYLGLNPVSIRHLDPDADT